MDFEQEKQLQHQNSQRSEEVQNLRTFVFQKLQTQQSQIIDFNLNFFEQKVDLSKLFEQYCPLKDNKISIYNPETNTFMWLSKINAEKNGKITKDLLQTKIILIRFKRRESNEQYSHSDSQGEFRLEQIKDKKDRSKQRTIGESIQLVKQWRSIHFNSIKSENKKISLFEAAKMVGISKKSLDDYYYQLRLGEYYNFDFQNHLDEKIGILRAYVKQFKPERDNINKNMRHPKHLKIIGNFDEQLPTIKIAPPYIGEIPIIEEAHNPSFKSLTIKQEQLYQKDKDKQNIFLNDVISSFHDNFFKNFQFLLDDPNDPFIGMNSNFQRKGSNNEFLFF